MIYDFCIRIIKEFIFYTETHKNVERTNNDAYLGKAGSTAYFIFYKKDEATCLNHALLKQVDIKADAYVIYADSCSLPQEFMEKHHIIFKKIPRDIQKI